MMSAIRKDWSVTRHGTMSGYWKHQRDEERPCDPCYRAKSQYDDELRKQPTAIIKARIRAKAQGKAHSELARRHHDEYFEVYEQIKQEEYRQAGIDA